MNHEKTICALIKARKWNEILSNENYLTFICSDKGRSSLFLYLNGNSHSDDLDQGVFNKIGSTAFLEIIRKTRYFLKPERLSFLKRLYGQTSEKQTLRIWEALKIRDTELWSSVENLMRPLLKMSLKNVLSHLIIWIEESRYKSKNDHWTVQNIARAYSLFIAYFLSHTKGKPKDISREDLQRCLLTLLKTKNNPLKEALEAIETWQSFKINELDAYCYESIDIQEHDGSFKFNKSPEAQKRFAMDGHRYFINQAFYAKYGYEYIEYLIEQDKIKIPGASPFEKEINTVLTQSIQSSKFFLNDLCIDHFVDKKGNVKVPIESLLAPLLGYSKNKYFKYVVPMDMRMKDGSDWREQYYLHYSDSLKKDMISDAFVCHTESEYLGLVQDYLKDTPISFQKEILYHFGYVIGEKFTFDRFHKAIYDVWTKPFLKIGDHRFVPTIFLAYNHWFYSFAQASLENIHKNPDAKKVSAINMEKLLVDSLKEAGFSVVHIPDEKMNGAIGDVDLIVEDENSSLLIQLKRTKFRLDQQSQYLEKVNVDTKAVNQLLEAKEYLSTNNKIHKLKPNVVLWYVSTSFEQIGSQEKEVTKVNYFELLHTLRGRFGINNLNELIDFIQNDQLICI